MSNVNPASAETIRLRAALAAAEARADEAESYSNADTETAAQFATRAFAAEAERDQLRGELREVRDQLAAAIAEHTERRENGWFTGECEDCGYPWHRSRGGCTARQHLIRFRDALSSPSTFTLNATQPGVDEHSDSRNATPPLVAVTPEPTEHRDERFGSSAFIEAACEVLHDAYEAAAVRRGWKSQVGQVSWDEVPGENQWTMRDAVDALLQWINRPSEPVTPGPAEPERRLQKSMDGYLDNAPPDEERSAMEWGPF